jgi:hypothetical protein
MSRDPYHPLPSARPTAIPWGRVLAGLLAFGSAALGVGHADGAPVARSPASSPVVLLQDLLVDAPAEASLAPDVEMPASPVDRADVRVAAERLFRGELASVKGVADFSRGAQTLVSSEGERADPVLSAAAAVTLGPIAPTSEVTGAELSETIFALQSDASAWRSARADADADAAPRTTSAASAGRSPRKAMQMFWEDADDADVVYGDTAVQLAAAGSRASGANVAIPLPAAALSGLTVLGGVTLGAGLRRLRQRLRR